MLAALDISDRNARQAIARLAENGSLRNERIGRLARWDLTPRSERLLAVGAERIYGFASNDNEWDGRWLLVLCSVPEEQRSQRPRLRARLGFEGFGFLTPTVAICAHIDREEAATRVISELGLSNDALVMRAEAGTMSPDRLLIARAWDLDSLGTQYREFVGRFERRVAENGPGYCAAVVDLVHAWRQFPFIDPELPQHLLPRRWPGLRAKELFDNRRAQWLPPALEWFKEFEATGSQ